MRHDLYCGCEECSDKRAGLYTQAESDLDFEDENETHGDMFTACGHCGLTDNHSIDCIHNHDPFVEFKSKGYD